MCDICLPNTLGVLDSDDTPARPLPDDAGAAIVEAVSELRWPLGLTGLTAMLLGSVAAPPSARRSPHFGVLSGASQADVKRWLKLLEVSGCIESFESDDGFRLLRVVPGVEVPRIATARASAEAPVDETMFEQLRAWRRDRASADAVPAYVVLHDKTLRELAVVKPRSPADLAAVSGFGPAKIERYGDDLLALIAAFPG